MFAIIRTDGKQYRVAQGDIVRLARMCAEPGDVFESDQVLAIGGEESELKFGSPVIVGAKVKGTVLKHGKDKKVIVFKRKRRKTYRRKYGHRQGHTMVKIQMISANKSSDKKVSVKKASVKKVSVKKVLVKETKLKKAAPVKTAVKKTATEQPLAS